MLGVFNTKKMSAEEIYRQVQMQLEKNSRLNLIELAKKYSKNKK